jgi:hypothetical protein
VTGKSQFNFAKQELTKTCFAPRVRQRLPIWYARIVRHSRPRLVTLAKASSFLIVVPINAIQNKRSC